MTKQLNRTESLKVLISAASKCLDALVGSRLSYIIYHRLLDHLVGWLGGGGGFVSMMIMVERMISIELAVHV